MSFFIRNTGWRQKPPIGVPIDRGHPLARGLVGFWAFQEGLGGELKDLSGFGNHGTLTNGPTWTTDHGGGSNRGGGYALSFDGSDDYVDVGNGSSLDIGTSDMSVSAWIKASSTVNDASWRDIVTKYDNSSDNDFAFQITANSGTPDVGSRAEGGLLANFNGKFIADNTAIDDGAWHHVSVTRANATTHSLYLDGTQLQSGAMSNANISGSTNWRIGRLGDNTQEFAGLIDDVRIYNRALSAEEIYELYTNPWGIFQKQRRLTILPFDVTVNPTVLSMSAVLNAPVTEVIQIPSALIAATSVESPVLEVIQIPSALIAATSVESPVPEVKKILTVLSASATVPDPVTEVKVTITALVPSAVLQAPTVDAVIDVASVIYNSTRHLVDVPYKINVVISDVVTETTVYV